MQIVINIPDELHIIQNKTLKMKILEEAIRKGVQLPKGHGRLIYAKDVGEYLTLADVPTIIEADKIESEE